MQALASFVQKDIRYVAIELGIGGVQPHPAAEVFAHRYGDCKDKVTSAVLDAQGRSASSRTTSSSTRVRGSVTANTPPNLGFNHAILAIQLPADSTPRRCRRSPRIRSCGRVLFFDPTQTLVPFGHLPGCLQANYGMLVTPEGGELVQLPQSTTGMRTA